MPLLHWFGGLLGRLQTFIAAVLKALPGAIFLVFCILASTQYIPYLTLGEELRRSSTLFQCIDII